MMFSCIVCGTVYLGVDEDTECGAARWESTPDELVSGAPARKTSRRCHGRLKEVDLELLIRLQRSREA
jgi:rubredoxin